MAFRISRLAKTDEDAAVIAHLAEIQLKAWLTVPLYALLYPGPPSTHPTVLNLTRTRHTESLLNDPWCHFLVASVPESSSSSAAAAAAATAATASASSSATEQQEWKPVAFVKYQIFPTAEAAQNRRDTGARRWSATPPAASQTTSSNATTTTPASSSPSPSSSSSTTTTTTTSSSSAPAAAPTAVNVALASSFWETIVATRKHHTAKLGAHVNVEILATLPEYHGRGAGRALLTQVLAEADAQGLTTVLEASQEGARLYHSVGFVPEEDGKFDLWVDLGRWEGGGDKGADWRGEASKEHGEGWYKQAVLLREPKSIS